MKPYEHSSPSEATSFTAKRFSIRIPLCIAAIYDLDIQQFHIASEFLRESYKHDAPSFVGKLPVLTDSSNIEAVPESSSPTSTALPSNRASSATVLIAF